MTHSAGQSMTDAQGGAAVKAGSTVVRQPIRLRGFPLKHHLHGTYMLSARSPTETLRCPPGMTPSCLSSVSALMRIWLCSDSGRNRARAALYSQWQCQCHMGGRGRGALCSPLKHHRTAPCARIAAAEGTPSASASRRSTWGPLWNRGHCSHHRDHRGRRAGGRCRYAPVGG